MNKCTRGATLHMSSTKLLVHTIGTVKFDLSQSTLETQLRVWACCWWTTVSAVNGKYRLQDEGMDEDWVCVGLTISSAQMCSQ